MPYEWKASITLAAAGETGLERAEVRYATTHPEQSKVRTYILQPYSRARVVGLGGSKISVVCKCTSISTKETISQYVLKTRKYDNSLPKGQGVPEPFHPRCIRTCLEYGTCPYSIAHLYEAVQYTAWPYPYTVRCQPGALRYARELGMRNASTYETKSC